MNGERLRLSTVEDAHAVRVVLADFVDDFLHLCSVRLGKEQHLLKCLRGEVYTNYIAYNE